MQKAKHGSLKIWIGCAAFCLLMGAFYGYGYFDDSDEPWVGAARLGFCFSIGWLFVSLMFERGIWPPLLMMFWSFVTQIGQL
jgi:hypothetical protein